MNLVRITLAVLGATAALVASACGGNASVPSDSIAVVDGTEISKEELDRLLEQAKKGSEANKQEFPKAGTPEYQSLQTQYVAYLVQRQEFRQAAEDLGIEIAVKDVAEAEEELIKSRFGGNEKEYEKALKAQGLTPEDYRSTLETSVLAQKLFEEITKDTKASDQDVLAYYTQNQSQYGTPESRDVRHILIAEKGADGQVDFEKSKAEADRIYNELKGGADFADLANTSSRGSREQGLRRQAHDLARSDRPRVRQDVVRAGSRRAVQAREDAVRLPRHRGRLAGASCKDDLARPGEGVDSYHAAPAEAERGHVRMGRGSSEEVRRQGQLCGWLRTAGGSRGTDRDPVGFRWLTGNSSPRGRWLRHIAGWRRPNSPVFPIRARSGGVPGSVAAIPASTGITGQPSNR